VGALVRLLLNVVVVLVAVPVCLVQALVMVELLEVML
jgi:hypothetical protein